MRLTLLSNCCLHGDCNGFEAGDKLHRFIEPGENGETKGVFGCLSTTLYSSNNLDNNSRVLRTGLRCERRLYESQLHLYTVNIRLVLHRSIGTSQREILQPRPCACSPFHRTLHRLNAKETNKNIESKSTR